MNDKQTEAQYRENVNSTQEVLYNEEFKKADAASKNPEAPAAQQAEQSGTEKA